jgi:hypothetical protein
LECIQDFSLDVEKVIITIPNTVGLFEEKGEFTLKAEVSRVEAKPYSYVYDYIVRTELANHMDQKWLLEARAVAKTKAENNGTKLYEDEEFQEFLLIEMDPTDMDTPKTIWDYTKLMGEYVYEFYCKATMKEAKIPKGVQTKKGYYPDLFQSVMATEGLLSEMFKEGVLHASLSAVYHTAEKVNIYNSCFGNFEGALVRAPFMESRFSKLPTGSGGATGGIPTSSMRRVISPKLASIAAFFAFACYDETSINRAYALLQKNMEYGDKIEKEEDVFMDELQLLISRKYGNYLFDQNKMDDGTNFVNNVVKVVNRIHHSLTTKAEFRPSKGQDIVLSRLLSHLFRTLCSDMVEIYVSHGCNPRCRKFTFFSHPGLREMIVHHHDRKGAGKGAGTLMPVPLLLEYIIILIAEGKVKVRTSHYFRGKPFELYPFEDTGTWGKGRTHYPRPKTNKIRYWYHCVGLNDGKKDVYMRLPELVNVILFKMDCPWDSESGQVRRVWPELGTRLSLSNPEKLWEPGGVSVGVGTDVDVGVGGNAKTKEKAKGKVAKKTKKKVGATKMNKKTKGKGAKKTKKKSGATKKNEVKQVQEEEIQEQDTSSSEEATVMEDEANELMIVQEHQDQPQDQDQVSSDEEDWKKR